MTFSFLCPALRTCDCCCCRCLEGEKKLKRECLRERVNSFFNLGMLSRTCLLVLFCCFGESVCRLVSFCIVICYYIVVSVFCWLICVWVPSDMILKHVYCFYVAYSCTKNIRSYLSLHLPHPISTPLKDMPSSPSSVSSLLSHSSPFPLTTKHFYGAVWLTLHLSRLHASPTSLRLNLEFE